MNFSKLEIENFDTQVAKPEEKRELERIRKRGSFLDVDLDDTHDETPNIKVEPVSPNHT